MRCNGCVLASDSQNFARLQDALRESKRQVDKHREKAISLEAARKQMEGEMGELHRFGPGNAVTHPSIRSFTAIHPLVK